MTEINPNIIPQGLLQEPAFLALKEAAEGKEEPKKKKSMPVPTAAENAFFLDPNKGDAYGVKKSNKRTLRQRLFGPTHMRQRIQEAALNATPGTSPDGKLDYFIDGVSVTKGLFGHERDGMTPADIFKAKRQIELKNLLNDGKTIETITGWDATTGTFKKEDVNVEGLETRARNLGLLEPAKTIINKDGSKTYIPGSKYINQFGALSPSKDMHALEKAVLLKEKEKAALKVAKANNVSVDDLQGKSIEEMEYLIRDARRRTGLQQEREATLFEADTKDIRTLQENGYDTSQIEALKSGKGLSPQGGKGLDPVSGAQRVQQRALTGNPQIDAMIETHRPINGSTPASLAKSLRERNAVVKEATGEMIGQAVAFADPQKRYNRAWDTYREKRDIYERNEDRLQALEDAEAAYEFKREQQRMDHEMKQYEIRETNKMLREQYEKELEIEESRRAENDFDNLTRMIMGMAGNL